MVKEQQRLTLAVFWAWVAMEAAVGLSFGANHYFGWERDPDVGSVAEAMMMPQVIMALPFAAIAAGVFLPLLAAWRVVIGHRLPRLVNTIAGGFLVIPAIVSVVVFGWMLGWSHRPLAGEFATLFHRLPAAMTMIVTFAVGGVVAGWTVHDPRAS